MDAELDNMISLFFMEPKKGNVIDDAEVKLYTNLYLLRKHVRICLCIDTLNKEPQAIWPAAMAILAGIDLLGLYYKGGEQVAGTNFYFTKDDDFKAFCRDCLGITNAHDQVIIRMLRNAFVHTYGLFTVDKKTQKIYKFSVAYDDKISHLPLISKVPSDSYSENYNINLYELYQKFESAINIYHDKLMNGEETDNFKRIFNQIGLMKFGPVILNP